ncbi:hypothetical protein B0H13DRAFT_1631358, partial [Mycena leptocephala]
YTVEETCQGPFSLLVTPSGNGSAFGSMYLADGLSDPPGPSTTVTVHATKNNDKISSAGTFHLLQRLAEVTILGITMKPAMILVSGKATTFTYASAHQKIGIKAKRGFKLEHVGASRRQRRQEMTALM